ncbi:hypothetical protein, partial [Halorubrum tebenquichense]|uniref:hypothetical protein n=1 Tax=Halorubrum tebenquichense TaxID=119434 RepID=UPI0019D3443A
AGCQRIFDSRGWGFGGIRVDRQFINEDVQPRGWGFGGRVAGNDCFVSSGRGFGGVGCGGARGEKLDRYSVADLL